MAKAIEVRHLDGRLEGIYKTTEDICRTHQGWGQCMIRHVLKGRRKDYKGCTFVYYEPKSSYEPPPENLLF